MPYRTRNMFSNRMWFAGHSILLFHALSQALLQALSQVLLQTLPQPIVRYNAQWYGDERAL
ncbi:hypothetical protein GCM10011382_11440 [Vreelandella lutescens]|uniref:Uncharacterized protein n=1 Tax=Vreelandella lutescens TaxID=1602943 RepID=A0ABQ1NQL6_9GAMM|nr:hypothetical protein GCM10011382_11440 [Halomonas lutescens]